MISLKDCGATVGYDASSALLRAFEKTVATNDQTILIDGHYLISNPVHFNFSNRISSLKIVGLGSKSRLIPHVVDDAVCLTLSGLDSLTLQDFVFSGYPNDLNDAGTVLDLSFIQQINFERTHFYGVACTKHAAIIRLSQSDAAFRDCFFYGCVGNSGSMTGLVHNSNWRGFSMQRCQFRDYGTLNGTWHSKTPLSASYSWVGFGDAATEPTNSWGTGMIRIEDSRFDEGALHAISITPNPATSPIVRGLFAKNILVNAFANQACVYVGNSMNAIIEDSVFGWTTNGDSQIISCDNVNRIRLTRCIVGQRVNGVRAAGTLNSFILEDCSKIDSIDVPSDKLIVINDGVRL